MTLDKDVPQPPGGGFDAVICLGNSFAHLPDCKGERGCGLGSGTCLELYPFQRGKTGQRLALGALSRRSLSVPAWFRRPERAPAGPEEHRKHGAVGGRAGH